ncbi:hypothetical protein [Dactylosporangium matsuzakiense]|uniref:Uncharacterized protein n=1 Tax=Dactylosporangium matsuzakiense TaxID=53360 RepID=A0A9W6KQ76_9ACTN|nr:hypothetical protein [Dactylosporangium matsuzakiense]GLL05115.1 hypothetical protein GCM10017581_068620 [Dactylosporangium matsuzakiense]
MADDETQTRDLMVRALMRTLRHGAAGTKWKEVAEGVLDGSASLQQAAASDAYRELFHDAAARLNEHRRAIGDEAFEAERHEAGEVLAKLTDRIRQERERLERGAHHDPG